MMSKVTVFVHGESVYIVAAPEVVDGGYPCASGPVFKVPLEERSLQEKYLALAMFSAEFLGGKVRCRDMLDPFPLLARATKERSWQIFVVNASKSFDIDLWKNKQTVRFSKLGPDPETKGAEIEIEGVDVERGSKTHGQLASEFMAFMYRST